MCIVTAEIRMQAGTKEDRHHNSIIKRNWN